MRPASAYRSRAAQRRPQLRGWAVRPIVGACGVPWAHRHSRGGPTKIAVSSDEDGTVSATGSQQQTSRGGKNRRADSTVRISGKKGGNKKLKSTRKQIVAGQTQTLKLKPRDKKKAKKLKKAVKKGAKAKAKITVTFTDLAGNETIEKLRFRLR